MTPNPESLAIDPEAPEKRGRVQRSYDTADVQRGLLQVAICNGNTRQAARQLKAAGHSIPRGTLRKWVDTVHVERYAEVREKVVPEIQAKMAREAEDLAVAYGDLEWKLLDELEEKLPNLNPGEIANALRNAATARAISTDKAQVLRNRPTEIVRHDVNEDVRALIALGVMRPAVDGTAEELPPAVELPPAA